MASVAYPSFNNHQTLRGSDQFMMKRRQGSSRAFTLDHYTTDSYGIETVGESDTLRKEFFHGQSNPSSEMGSEDSCSMRHNKVNSNCTPVDACNSSAAYFCSGMTNISRSERNYLRRKLKLELTQVQEMISRLNARELDLRSLLRMPELDNNGSSSKSVCEVMQTQEEYSEIRDSEQMAKKSKVKGGVKRALHLNADLPIPKRQKSDSDARKIADIMRQCGTILRKLRTHKYSWVFNQAVDYVALNIPDYPLIVKHPMDLGTIKTKLESHQYESPAGFAADVRLTFNNAMTYNPEGHDVHVMADSLLKLFEERWKPVDRKLQQLNLEYPTTLVDTNELSDQNNEVSALAGDNGSVQNSSKNESNGETFARPMTYEEKQALSLLLEEVPMDKLEKVMEIITRKDPDVKPVDGEVTIEIDCLDSEALWELHDLLKHPTTAVKSVFYDSKQKPISGDSDHPSLAKSDVEDVDAKDEEVDIGEDVAEMVAPTVVVKDTGSCSSPSSSSSSDSSSSSGSDSSSSSESESDTENLQPSTGKDIVTPRKEPEGSASVFEPMGSPALKVDDGKRQLSDLDEEITLPRPTVTNKPAEGEGDQQGEDSALESQVSERLLRAALLKNRFADTILKAREKTMPHGLLSQKNGTDPERVRKEREELERIQREEKARLLAEGKAAEIARKKCEAEALARAKLERQAERQAARLVLQQMEKTVEIDENDDYLKDLEMLGRAPPSDVLPKASESESSPSEDGLGGFAFSSGNPLERLGLFMKVDEEEEQDTAGTLEEEEEEEEEKVKMDANEGVRDLSLANNEGEKDD